MKGDMKPMSVGATSTKKNFKITDEDESCVGDLFDPCGVCITKGELRDGTLVNRLLMCCFAVVLLWASSFQTAVFIANSSVSSPVFSAVRDSCDAAYEQSKGQKQDYIDCVDRQLDDCDASFEAVLNTEVKKTNEQLLSNAQVLSEVAAYQEACSESFTTAQAAISKWVTTGIGYRLYYTCPHDATEDDPTTPYCNATCGYEALAAKEADLEAGGDGRGFQRCSCAEVADMVGDVGALRAAAFASATDYAEYSKGVVTNIVDYSLARTRYDSIYAYNKTEPLRRAYLEALRNLNAPRIQDMNLSFEALKVEADMMMACVTMRDQVNHTSCTAQYIDSLMDLYRDAREETERQIELARDGVEEMLSETSAYVTKVLDSLTTFMEFYTGVFDDLSSFSVTADDDLPWLSMGVDSFYAPEPDWPAALGQRPYVPGAAYIFEDAVDQFGELSRELDKAGAAVGKAAEAMGAALEELADNFGPFSPDDYNPPTYADYAPASSGATTEEQAEDEHAGESTAFEYSTASSLNAFAELNAYLGDDTQLSSYNLSYASGDDDLSFSGLQFKFETLTADTIDWDLIYFGVTAMFNLIIGLDFIYRFFKTLYYIRQFWTRAGLEIPAVDIRQDKYTFSIRSSSSSSGSGGGEGCASCVMCLLCPCWGAAFCLVLCVIVAVNLVILYIPVVNEYSQVCVNHQGNGTFLTGNIYSIAYNYAAEAGNEDMIDGLEAYNTRTADYCGAYTTFTQEQQAEDELLLADLRVSQRRTRDDLLMVDQCVNLTVMDGLFERACCDATDSADYAGVTCSDFLSSDGAPLWYSGATNKTCPRDVNGDPYPRLSSLVDAHANADTKAAQCLEDPAEWEIGDASFYCSALPECAVTCNGPNRALLREASEQCGCMAEWMMHTWWVQVLGAVVVYCILNLSRVVVLSGFVRLCWRWMSPNCFTYRATTTLDGYYLPPPMSSKYPSFKKMLHAELGKEMKTYERAGWVLMLAGLGLNYIWVYYFAFFNDGRLYYDPNAR